MPSLYQVTAAKRFVAGFEVDPLSRRIISAAPAVQWARGRTIDWFSGICRENGWELILLA